MCSDVCIYIDICMDMEKLEENIQDEIGRQHTNTCDLPG